MDIGSILLLLALVVIVGIYVASPLRERRSRISVGEVDIELSQLLAERERILEALSELDFDNEMGKVPDNLYPLQREALVKRGATVLRLLDEHVLGEDEPEDSDSERVKRLEQAASILGTEDDPLEAIIAARRAKKAPARAAQAVGTGQPDKFCSECGAEIQPGDQFCPSCGNKLT